LTAGDDVDNVEDDTESESNGSVSNEIGERESDKDYVLIDVIETVITHEETGNTRGKHVVTGGTQDEASSKKPKSTMTEVWCVVCGVCVTRDLCLKVQDHTVESSLVRKLATRHVDGRGSSKHKNGEGRGESTNSPNSCPPDRLFSIFNSTFDVDQSSSYVDYM